MSVGGKALDLLSYLSGLHRTDGALWNEVNRTGYIAKMAAEEITALRTSIFLSSPDVLGRSAVVWIAKDMVLLLQHAARSLPPYAFNPSILPWRNAVCFSEEPLLAHATLSTVRDIVGLQWAESYMSGTTNPAWRLAGLAKNEKHPAFYRFHAGVEIGDSLEGDFSVNIGGDGVVRTGPVATAIAPMLCTLWLLLQQRVAVRRHLSTDRGSRRRFLRNEQRDPPLVTVIELRKPIHANTGQSTSEREAVDWSHQWIVDGHWREQYHPSDQSHVPTWIAPYVKGPEDKPLIVKQRVHAWVR